jgi:TonB family protein
MCLCPLAHECAAASFVDFRVATHICPNSWQTKLAPCKLSGSVSRSFALQEQADFQMKNRIAALIAASLIVTSFTVFSSSLANPVSGIRKALQPVTGKPAEAEKPELRDKWALVLGCNRFTDPQIASMKFASKNAADIARILKDQDIGRFAPDHVLLLNGPDATNAAAKQAIDEWLLKKALPNDFILIYISSRIFAGPDGMPMICTSDTKNNQPETALNLYETLRAIKQRTRSEHIICMIDTQPQGEVPDPKAEKGTDKDKAKADGKRDLKWLATTGVTVFGANELFKPSFDDQSMLQSRFAHFFVEGMKQSAGAAPFYEVAEFVFQNVKQDAAKASGQEQSPSLVLSNPQSVTASIPLGIPLKSSFPQGSVAVGHSLDDLAMERPDLIAPKTTQRKTIVVPPKAAARPPAQTKPDDEDDDDVNPHLDMGSYMTKMKQDIHSKWQPPKGLESRRVSVVFSIQRTGAITNPEIVDSSGNEEVDKSALAALSAASPLDPLPKGAPRSVDIRYVFDWKTSSKSTAGK